MATTITASPPAMSPPLAAASTTPPSLPPLVTSMNPGNQRRTSSQRPASWVDRRMSSYSSASKASHPPQSRPSSHVFPAFHSSLSYTLVRDFAYLSSHPLHYGPLSNHQSDVSTPVSEYRRMSDPAISTWEDARGQWSASPPWMSENNHHSSLRDRLPAMTFNDGGPPYSEDEDIQSPIVMTSRHKKHKSSAGNERGRSPGAAGPHPGVFVGADGQQYTAGDDIGEGPGDAVETDDPRYPHEPQHRDSNFARPLQRSLSPYDGQESMSDDDYSDADNNEARYSKDYSFTIASPDEEMHGKAVALFDFESEHPNELPLKEGQIILVSYRHGQGWLVAEDPRTGESGLVPEEFVRLVRDIEGGLNGLKSVTLDEGNGDGILTPASNDPGFAHSPSIIHHDVSRHLSKPSSGSNHSGEKHPPVQSSFSTSSKDFHPYPLPGRREESPMPSGAAGHSSRDNVS